MMKLIETLIKTGIHQEKQEKALPEHDNIRGKNYYEQLNINFKS